MSDAGIPNLESRMPDDSGTSERMRRDWNERAREDANYYVAFGARDQDEEAFFATGDDVVKWLETELNRLPRNANRRAWRALEIGCGPGRLMKPLSRHFGEIHGVDVSDEMIRMARERLRGIPHAHVHATNGASLAQFADQSFDFVYSYAVFQHIPSRDVVLEYMHEIRRVLKPGAIFRGQFNGLPHSAVPDTWSGVVFSDDDIRAFTSEHRLQLLDLAGVDTQYMWTTWRKPGVRGSEAGALETRARRVTNAHSWEPAVPNRGRHAAISVWMENLPDECDLNGLEITVDDAAAIPFYIGPAAADGLQQVNAWLPADTRTGLLPVELLWNGENLCEPATVRVIPSGPLVPRIVTITDGVNLVQKNASSTGLLKIQIEELKTPEAVTAQTGGNALEHLGTMCIDPRVPSYEVNFRLPPDTPAGHHILEVFAGRRRLLPIKIEVFQSVGSESP